MKKTLLAASLLTLFSVSTAMGESIGVYDGAGNLLGSLLGEYHAPISATSQYSAPSGYTVLSLEGYIYPLDTRFGTVHKGQYQNTSSNNGVGVRKAEIYYTNGECSGGQAYIQGYSEYLPSDNFKISFPVKAVFYGDNNSGGNKLWYSGENLFYPDEVAALYHIDGSNCVRGGAYYDPVLRAIMYLEVFPNDPDVTGIPSEPVTLPISYKVQPKEKPKVVVIPL